MTGSGSNTVRISQTVTNPPDELWLWTDNSCPVPYIAIGAEVELWWDDSGPERLEGWGLVDMWVELEGVGKVWPPKRDMAAIKALFREESWDEES